MKREAAHCDSKNDEAEEGENQEFRGEGNGRFAVSDPSDEIFC